MKPTGRGSGPERGGLSREKRPLEKDGTSDGAEEEKRQRLPALASVILEAVKMDSLQKLCSQLEPVLRRVVGEEVERALAKFVPAKLGTSARSTMSGTYMREHMEKANWQVYESKSIVHRLPRVLIWELNTTSIYSFLHLIWSAASADRSHHYSELFELDFSEYSGLSDAGIQDMPLNEHVSALWELLFLFFQTAICFWQ